MSKKLLSVAALLSACGVATPGTDGLSPGETDPLFGSIPWETQRAGDPEAGYQALVNEGYVSCGIPASLWDQIMAPAPESGRIPGRNDVNEAIPYNFTRYDSPSSGVELVSANCLTCHGERLLGEVVVGLGNHTTDFTQDPSGLAAMALPFVTDEAEKAEIEKFLVRLNALAPHVKTATIGVNPADNVTAVLLGHRDPETLQWLDEAIVEMPPHLVPVDVPPWWNMRKKSVMFYTAAGRGDHSRIMMTASTLCTDSVAEAEDIYRYFGDIRAFISSIEPPPYPFDVDSTLAATGQEIFEATCARCHGTYGDAPTYPNLVIAPEEIGTDPQLGEGAAFLADDFIDWYEASYYGQGSRIVPSPGYVAPPLDGVWATAPYLHNGSVPTIATLLDSPNRPTFWTRSFDTTDYDSSALGWTFEAVAKGHADIPDAALRKQVYDTTQLGYGNMGHTFGDHLSASDRAAVLEYLKTL